MLDLGEKQPRQRRPAFQDRVHHSWVLSALPWVTNQSLERPSGSDQNLEKSLDKREAKGNFTIQTRNCKDEMVNGE